MTRRIIIIVIAVAVLGGGGYFVYQRLNASKTSATANLQTTTVSTGTLVASVAASGSLASPQTGSVAWQVNGIVGTVKVKVGDQVNAGDVLMSVDQTRLDTSIVQAQAQLLTDQQALTNLITPANLATSLAQAQAALLTDQQNLTTLTSPATDAQIANANLAVVTAQQAITTAQRNVGYALNPAGQSLYDAINTAKVSLDQASANAQLANVSSSVQQYTQNFWLTDFYWKRYQDLQAKADADPTDAKKQSAANAYNDWKVLADKQATLQLTFQSDQEGKNSALAAAQTAYDKAQSQLNGALAGPDQAKVQLTQQQLTVAQAAYKQAQADLAKLQAGPTAADVAAVKAKIAADQTTLANLQAGPTDADIASAKARVAVDQANLAKLTVVAPFTGTVVAVNTNPGDTVTPGTVAVQLADLRSLQVSVSVSEVDINRLKVGQEVDLSLDAVQGKTFTGTVSSIGYLGTSTQGVVNFPVTVVIQHPDPTLKPGMTASAAVVTEKKSNVLVVPNRAIHVTGGQRTVTVLFEGLQIPVTVQVGLSNDTQSEITSANPQLKDGDTIVLNATTAASAGGGGGGGGGGFGGGGFRPGG